MPKFEIAEDAFKIATGAVRPMAVTAALPELPAGARRALADSERFTRVGTLTVMRRVAADRETAQGLCEWFVKTEATLRQSPDSIDQSRSRMCGIAAKAIAQAFPADTRPARS